MVLWGGGGGAQSQVSHFKCQLTISWLLNTSRQLICVRYFPLHMKTEANVRALEIFCRVNADISQKT